MIELEYKINSFSANWTKEQKRAFLNQVFEMIASLKSYCEIEIYLIELSEKIQKDIKKVTKNFLSMYEDKNKKAAEFVVVKYIEAMK